MQGYRVVIEWTGTIDLPRGTVDAEGTELHVGDVVRFADADWQVYGDYWYKGVFRGAWIRRGNLHTHCPTSKLVKVKA